MGTYFPSSPPADFSHILLVKTGHMPTLNQSQAKGIGWSSLDQADQELSSGAGLLLAWDPWGMVNPECNWQPFVQEEGHVVCWPNKQHVGCTSVLFSPPTSPPAPAPSLPSPSRCRRTGCLCSHLRFMLFTPVPHGPPPP